MSINIGTAVGYLDLDANKFKNALKSAQSSLSDFANKSNDASTRFKSLGSSLNEVGSVISKTVSVPLLALGAGAIKVAGDFQAGMSEVSAITGATGNDLAKLENQAKELGSTTKFSARDAAEGMKFFGMAGYDTNQIMNALPATLNLAAAGGTDLGIACDIVSDAMTGLGMSANETAKFTDIMAATITNSNTSVELMGETLRYVGPVAGTLGIGMGDLSVAIGLMGNAGIKGSQAGTALRSGLTNLVKPTKEMKATMEQYGVELVKNKDGSVDLMGTMDNLRNTLGGLDQTTQAQALSAIFGKEAMSGWAAIVNASESDFDKLSDAIANSEGKASDMATIMQDNLKGSIDNLKSSFEGFMIIIGERIIPLFRDIVDGITNMFTWFNNLNPSIQGVIIGVGGFLAVLGPLLLIIGNVIIFITNLGTAIGSLVAFFTAGGTGAGLLAGAIGFITSPIGLVIAAITALISIGVLLYKNWDEIKAKCTEIWQNNIKPTIEKVTNTVKDIINTVWNGIKNFITAIWEGIKQSASTVWNSIKTTVENICNSIKDFITTIWNAIKTVISTVWDSIKNIITNSTNTVKSIITTVFNLITSTITSILKSWENIISTVWNSIKTIVTNSINSVKSIIQSVFTAINGIIQATSNGWKSVIQATWDGIKTIVSNGVNAVKNVITTVWSGLKSLLIAPFEAAKSVIDGILGGISSAISSVTSAISSVKNAASNVIDKFNPFKNSRDIAYTYDPINNYNGRSNEIDMVKKLVYSDNVAKTSIADSFVGINKSLGEKINKSNDNKGTLSNSIVINNTYNSPKPTSIRELKKQDEIQMRRLAMQLKF